MPRKALRQPPALSAPTPSAPPSWLGYGITALLAVALTAGALWLAVVRPLRHTAPAAPLAPSAAALVSAGDAAFDRKDWNAAVQNYSQAIAQGQDNPDVRTDLGTAYRELHQPQQALTEYAAAQREDPNHQNSLVNEGIVYAFDLGQTGEAMNVWHQYLRRFPTGAHVADVKRLMTLAASPVSKTASEKP